MAPSRMIGICGHPDVVQNIVGVACHAYPKFADAFAASGSAWMPVHCREDLAELRRHSGLLVAVVTGGIPAEARKLAEYADRTVTGRTVHVGHFTKVVREIIYGRPEIDRNDPKQVRPL